MNIIIENETNVLLNPEITEIIKKAIIATADSEHLDYEFEVSVTITDNERIRRINKDYREKDRPTDVLSFPLIEYSKPGDFSGVSENEHFDLDTGDLILGDIILSYETALKQADEYGHSLEREIGFLVIHSMLHLFGYDHMNEADEALMIERQKLVLGKVDLKR